MERIHSNEVPARLRIEALAMVILGIRPLALISLPAELSDGNIIGRMIDEKYLNSLEESVSGPIAKRLAFNIKTLGKTSIARKRVLLRQAYKEIVEDTPIYKNIIDHAQQLGASTYSYEVRPSIHELYIHQAPWVQTKLRALMEERKRIRELAWAKASPHTPYSLLTYPEEQYPDYLTALGSLLGYPSCCTTAYARDRAHNVNVELRASHDLQSRAGMSEVEPWAYFVKDFFPCQPDCPAASHVARQAYASLQESIPELAEAFLLLLKENQERVLTCPEAIYQHLKYMHPNASAE